jgi:hypothetical protein
MRPRDVTEGVPVLCKQLKYVDAQRRRVMNQGEGRSRRFGGVWGLALLWVLCGIIGGALPGVAATPPDDRWADNFSAVGMSDTVCAVTMDGDGNIYAGGNFTTAGGVSANRIARWDGRRVERRDSQRGSCVGR